MVERPAGNMSAVTAVVPNGNRRDLLERLLVRLGEQTHPVQEVLVVDTGSTDGAAELARARGARVIVLDRRTSLSAAVNRGIQEARTEWIAIVSSDVEPARDWLEHLAAALRQPRVWFATGKTLDAANPRALDSTFEMVCRGACAWCAGHGCPDGPLWGRRRRIHVAPFTATLFRASLFRRIGRLDERFQSCLQEADFCLRCAVAGMSGLYEPAAVASRSGAAAPGRWSPETVRHISRGQLLLMAKHYPKRYFVRYAWFIVVAQSLWAFEAFRHGRPLAYARGQLEGLAMFWSARRDFADANWRERLSKILEKSETEMFRLQRRSRFDPFWRAYFALTSFT